MYVALLLISAPTTTRADVGQDERTAVSGSVWVIPGLPEQLTIFEIKPDGTVKAGRWGYAGMEKEEIWIGTFRNGRLELKNENLAYWGVASETITATIVGSQITGKYKHTAPAINSYDDRDFSGYCLNCFGYGPVVAVFTILGLLMAGTVVLVLRKKPGLAVSVSPTPIQRYCTKCSQIVPIGKIFCTNCGKRW